MDTISLDKQYVAGTYGRFPLELVSGKGCLFYDAAGKEYIDMGTGIGVTAFGTGDETWVQAVTAQLQQLTDFASSFDFFRCTFSLSHGSLPFSCGCIFLIVHFRFLFHMIYT